MTSSEYQTALAGNGQRSLNSERQCENPYLQKALAYGAGHPWYYYLGGPVLSVKTIRANVKTSGYKGWRRDYIEAADRLPEPKRSQRLRQLMEDCLLDLKLDISGYRRAALRLSQNRRTNGSYPLTPSSSGDVHTAMSLKHNHLFNDFAHLIWLDELLGWQLELF